MTARDYIPIVLFAAVHLGVLIALVTRHTTVVAHLKEAIDELRETMTQQTRDGHAQAQTIAGLSVRVDEHGRRLSALEKRI